ncbi:MAG: hypothetical protein QM772_07980 [Ottowia sp.]|uniref:hypothetical protein n=1 Tax=Ottowia sp. TaxID=1898956 RepID=UPI0039E43A84
MKKSILSLSAAVALGGLGFAGSANAWVASSDDGAATGLFLHAAGVGHQLFTPYYTANAGMATLVNIVNTDSTNGKAVKVRFRSATNSDDVLDFTLFLSPADVWTGAVLQGTDGRASLITNDKSCTIPVASQWPTGGVPFITTRLPSYATDDVKAALTREGYIEVLNMADIDPDSDLFTATKHVNGVAPCLADTPLTGSTSYSALRNNLLNTTSGDAGVSGANADGLVNPTGGLMGTWAVLDLANMGTYSGTQTAVIATADTSVGASGTVTTAAANLQFFPQHGLSGPTTLEAADWTADPLLTGGVITPLWFDFPDMSTPAIAGEIPNQQAYNLSNALAKTNVINEYIATAADASVPFLTDWVVSQPTRRYHAAVSYGTVSSAAAIVLNTGSYANPYSSLLALQQTDYGPQACLQMTFQSTDREEYAVATSVDGGFSPGTPASVLRYCGEVFVAKFGSTSSLQAVITAGQLTPAADAGWGTLGAASALPIVGYAATLFSNTSTGNKYGMTFQHRWLSGGLTTP